jgi:hypothetical protein
MPVPADKDVMEPIVDQALSYMDKARRQRRALLAALYHRRLANPTQPHLNLADLEKILGVTKAEFEFNLWYLTDGQYVKRTDNGNHAISLKGVDLAEIELDRAKT